MYFLVSLGVLMFLFDAQNVLSRWRRHVIDVDGSKGSQDYTLCLTLYGHPRYFVNREWLRRWQSRVLVILSNMTPEYVAELRAEGWRVFEVEMERPSPPAMIRDAIDAGQVTTKYAVRMDADVETKGDIDAAIGAMDAAGAHVCSVKTHVLNERASVWTRLQALEYRMSMLGRHNRPWCLSGAFFVVRTDLLGRIYHRHSAAIRNTHTKESGTATQRREILGDCLHDPAASQSRPRERYRFASSRRRVSCSW